MPDCVLAIINSGDGRILLGQRDDGLWSTVAGHIEGEEKPYDAMVREIYEETGLNITKLHPMDVTKTQDGSVLYCFSCLSNPTKKPHSQNDPDQEFNKFKWVDVRQGIPSNIWKKLAHPDPNVLKEVFDLQKSELDWSEIGLKKTEEYTDDILSLLNHPNPSERCLALKMHGVNSHHLGLALLDPDELVFRTAFKHPEAPLDILASHTRDLSGSPIFHRHDLLLNHPNLTSYHLDRLNEAHQNDPHLPIDANVERMKKTESYRLDLVKKEWSDKAISAGSSYSGSKHEEEPTIPEVADLKESFEKYQPHLDAIKSHEELPDPGHSSPKVIYHIPHGNQNIRVMVKPYAEKSTGQYEDRDSPLSGWSEQTNQSLYHASGIGNLHQKVFTSQHGEGEDNKPVTVIKLENATPIWQSKSDDKNKHQAKQIAIHDFLIGNADRHDANVMRHNETGDLLAIDHGAASDYQDGDDFEGFAHSEGLNNLANLKKPGWDKALNWFSQNSDKIKQTYEDRLKLLHDPIKAAELRNHFDKRADWLDRRAKDFKHHPKNWWSQK